MFGHNALVSGSLDDPNMKQLAATRSQGMDDPVTLRIPRRNYADLYGPTTGDRVRLADSELIVEVERDYTVYGDEVTFGGGKVIRDGMGQSSVAVRDSEDGALDLVITNALIIDHWGIVKGDIGVKDGKIVAVGKAGNPDTMAGVHPSLVIGAFYRGHRRRKQHRHRWRRRYAHPLHLPSASRNGAHRWHHDYARRWNWACDGNKRHDMHAGIVEHGANATSGVTRGR